MNKWSPFGRWSGIEGMESAPLSTALVGFSVLNEDVEVEMNEDKGEADGDSVDADSPDNEGRLDEEEEEVGTVEIAFSINIRSKNPSDRLFC